MRRLDDFIALIEEGPPQELENLIGAVATHDAPSIEAIAASNCGTQACMVAVWISCQIFRSGLIGETGGWTAA